MNPNPMLPIRVLLSVAITAALLVPAPASAFDTFFVGPRALAMAGANVASTRDTTAQYYNPGVFGFFSRTEADGEMSEADASDLGSRGWGVNLDAGFGYRLHNQFGSFLDDLSKIDRNALSSGGVQSASDLADLVRVANNLKGLEEPGNGITVDLTAGLGVRVHHVGVGVRGFAQASGRVVSLDTTHLGLSGTTDLNGQVNGVTVENNDGQVALFTPEQVTALTHAGLDATAIQKLDFVARQEGMSSNAVSLLTDIVDQTGSTTGGALEDNTTTVRLNGFGVVEVPITYGYAINDRIAVGANLKLMRGRVYGTEVVVFDKDSGDVVSDITNDYKESTNFGLDLGVMGRYDNFQAGLVVRNLNAPKFDGPTVNGTEFSDVTVDPQATVGVAYFPLSTLTLEADLDLLPNETSFDGYDTQKIALGIEWDAFHVLALRAGLYNNLAEDDIGNVYTVGLGLNLWAVRLDLAGAFAADSEQYNGDNIPKETRLAAQLAVDF